METTRTAAGYRLFSELCEMMAADEALKVVQQRVKVRATLHGEDGAHVETQIDGGEWIDEGLYKIKA